MAKKKIISAEEIGCDVILPIYQEVLPLLYSPSEEKNPVTTVKKWIAQFIEFDSFHYLMDDPTPPAVDEKFHASFEQYQGSGKHTDITIKPLKDKTFDDSFTELANNGKDQMIAYGRKTHPERTVCFYHQIRSEIYPKMMAGFLRFGKPGEDRSFSDNDVLILDKLAPHIHVLLRTVLSPVFKSSAFEYYDTYVDICSKIAHDYELSDTELKFLPEILFGRSNEEIAKKYFVSIATVKTHIKHIFKKTNSKNRVDFISTFFTSPDRLGTLKIP